MKYREPVTHIGIKDGEFIIYSIGKSDRDWNFAHNMLCLHTAFCLSIPITAICFVMLLRYWITLARRPDVW